MQDKIELTQVRSFSEIIEDSIQFFKQNWKPLLKAYFIICGFFWVAGLAVSIMNSSAMIDHTLKHESVLSITYFLSAGFDLLDFLLVNLTVLCFIALYKEKGNEAPTVPEVWSYVRYFFLRILGSYLALGALIIAGFVCCILPGIYLVVVFSLTFPVMVMENTTLRFAFNRSFQIIKENWWFTLGVAIVIDIVIYAAMASIVIPVVIVTYATSFLTTANVLTVYTYSTVIVSHTAQFLYILPVIALSLTYFSLTEIKYEGTLLNRIMMLGKQVNASEEPPLAEEY